MIETERYGCSIELKNLHSQFVFHTFSSIQKPRGQNIFHHKVTKTEFLHVRTFAARGFSCAFPYLLGSYWYPDKYFEILICRDIIEV